jgi:hypothetical protein
MNKNEQYAITKTDKVETNIIENDDTDDDAKFEINISTKTKTLYFNKVIDIYRIFWTLPIINYSSLCEGLIKKEIKILNNSKEETEQYEEKLKEVNPVYYVEHVLKNIDNPKARKLKYKNQRKLIIGICKKDILKKTMNIINNNDNEKIKGAFRNCLVLIIRLLDGEEFRETHIKIFSTGIIKIPGILNISLFNKIKKKLYSIINLFEVDNTIPLSIVEEDYSKLDSDKNVLINSTFKCGFNIYLEKLYNILRSEKYNIEVSMDTTTYPALRCKFYFHTETGYDFDKQTGVIKPNDMNMNWKELNDSGKYKKVSVMIFRTGNGLIMGKISENTLKLIYEKFKMILIKEKNNIKNDVIDKVKLKVQSKSKVIKVKRVK